MAKAKFLVAGLLATILALVPLGTASAHWGGYDNIKTIMPGDLALPPGPTTTQDSWYFYNDNSNAPSTTELPGNYEFVTGVGNPPFGAGSLKFTDTSAGDRWNIATNNLAGKNLTELNKLSFRMYVLNTSTGGTTTTLFLNVDVDFDNTTANGYQGRLIYLPQDNGSVSLDTWQKWDAINSGNGVWQWSRFVSNGNQWPDGNTDPTRTWDEIKTVFPNAEVFNESFTGQTLIRAGHPGPAGLEGYLDGFRVNDTTYNFENDECVFVTEGNKYKLMNDCITTETILIPQDKTLDGQWHQITAKDPSGGHFLGAVVKNAGDKASVKNLKIYAGELAIVCDEGADRLRGILFDGASGKIENNKILAVNQGDSGCQEGNGIEVRNFGPGDTDITSGQRKKVKIKNNFVQDFNKGGIVANGYIRVTIADNYVKSPGLTGITAANGIQLAFNAKGAIKDNKVEGNQWSGGGGWAATAILIYLVEDPVVKNNYITGNSDIGIAVEDTYGAVVKNNKVKDSGTDLNTDSYDIGIENAYYDLNPDDGEANFFCGNYVSGFNTPFDGVDQKKCGKYKNKHNKHHGHHHKHHKN